MLEEILSLIILLTFLISIIFIVIQVSRIHEVIIDIKCDTLYLKNNIPKKQSGSDLNVKEDFVRIKKLCKGVQPGYVINIPLHKDYDKNREKYNELCKKCLKKNWILIFNYYNGCCLAVMNQGDNIETIASNLSLVTRNSNLIQDITLKLSTNFNCDELKLILKDKYNIYITCFKMNKACNKGTFRISKIK